MNIDLKNPFFKIKLEDIGKLVIVQTGFSFSSTIITEPMVGLSIGQLSCTKKMGPSIHVNKKSKKSKKK